MMAQTTLSRLFMKLTDDRVGGNEICLETGEAVVITVKLSRDGETIGTER